MWSKLKNYFHGIVFLKVEVYAGAIYDAIYLYAIALNETLAAGGDKKDGRAIVHRMLNKEFEGSCSCDKNNVYSTSRFIP